MGEKGLESKEALRRLHSELEATLAICHARRSHVAWMKEAWHCPSCAQRWRGVYPRKEWQDQSLL